MQIVILHAKCFEHNRKRQTVQIHEMWLFLTVLFTLKEYQGSALLTLSQMMLHKPLNALRYGVKFKWFMNTV